MLIKKIAIVAYEIVGFEVLEHTKNKKQKNYKNDKIDFIAKELSTTSAMHAMVDLFRLS